MSAETALTEKAQAYLIESLCCAFQIFDQRMVIFHTEEKSKLLNYLVENKYISRFMVASAVRHRLIDLGNEMYRQYLTTNQSPDHLGSQDIFGYYLKNNVQFIPSVHFDYGETADGYIKSSEGLVTSVLDQLFNYKSEANQFREIERF